MKFIGWMYDIAREQSPSDDDLDALCAKSLASGYNVLGLYLEHRFEYPSAPWAVAPGALSGRVVRALQDKYVARGLRIIPFLNTLGHMEGFVRAVGGGHLSEGPRVGAAQLCPLHPETVPFVQGLIRDALAVFDDEWLHIGGDETQQLGQCPRCAARVAEIGKAGLYGEYYGALTRWVLEQGRRPCLWGDMLLEHPEAMDHLPRETVIFDWQYEQRPHDTSARFREAGFDVVCCPSIQTYNSGWCYLEPTQRYIDEHREDALALRAEGVLVTTWEFAYFQDYPSTLPIVYAAGRRLAQGAAWEDAIRAEGGESYARLAEILGETLPQTCDFLRPPTWRQLRDRFVMRQNPFALWQVWRDDACGPVGDRILTLCEEADNQGPRENLVGGALELHAVAVHFVRRVEEANRAWESARYSDVIESLQQAEQTLLRLQAGLSATASAGGSPVDPHRLERLCSKVRVAAQRVAEFAEQPPVSGYRPTFEVLVHDSWLPEDQAAWRAGMIV